MALDLEHKERNERLAKLEDFIRETRDEKLQEEAKAAASAAKEEAIERRNRDDQIRASLVELTSRQKGEEVKRNQEQLLAALDARREEAEAKAAAEHEKYLKLEVQRNEDADRRVAEALAETRAVFAEEMAELKNAAQKAAASARAAMKSKKLAEAESAKRARDAAQKTAEEEKRRLIDEYKLLLEEYRTRLLDVEQAEAAAEARHQETKAAPTRQLRMEDGDRRMELIETQHGMSEPLANTDFLASTFFQNRKPSPFFSRAGRSPARPRTQRTTSDVRSLSSEESEEDRRDALSGKTVVLLPSAENTSESEMLEIRTALQESGFSASNSLVPFKGHKARRSKGIPATFQWDSPLSAESQLLLTMKEHGWKPIYRRITDTLVSLTMQRREINLHKRYNLTIEAPSDQETESSVDDSEMYQSKEQGAFEDPGYQDQGWTEGWNTDEREQVSEPWNQLEPHGSSQVKGFGYFGLVW
ncbi:hypothetical protein SLS56_006338 [Neofusicoccum ribis]|uniref:Uncharacterized protein n=1 Tax=Neofusicoccum ribis TaxID=45134 RepID=A0ABR3SRA1_9PEZI